MLIKTTRIDQLGYTWQRLLSAILSASLPGLRGLIVSTFGVNKIIDFASL